TLSAATRQEVLDERVGRRSGHLARTGRILARAIGMTGPGDSDWYSITGGGLLRRVEAALHLTRRDELDWIRRTAAFLAVAYAPALVVGAIWRLATGEWDPVIGSFQTHSRALIALPLLLVGEQLVDERARDASTYLTASGV